MQKARVQSLGWEDPLEKGMATQSSIHAWRIPWTEEPAGLQSTGSQRVRHAWADLEHSFNGTTLRQHSPLSWATAANTNFDIVLTLELTGCHCAGYQAGGQLKRLQACTVVGLGWRHSSSARITVSFISLESRWEQKTSLVCSPTPQVRLQGLHLLISHLWRNQRKRIPWEPVYRTAPLLQVLS